jgi:AraC family transcriptional regulator
VQESTYPGETAIPPHEHTAAFFDYIVAGGCIETLGTRRRQRDSATLAFHPAGEVHASQWHGADARCFHIELPSSLIERAKQYSAGLSQPSFYTSGKSVWLAARLYAEFERPDPISDLAIEGLTLELLCECSSLRRQNSQHSPPRWLRSVCDCLHSTFSERLSLSALAASVGVHPAHLAREFRRFRGCSIGEYVRRLRVEFACMQIRCTDASFAEIALRAGFFDQSHFSNVFRRYLGESPSAFRESLKERKSAANPSSFRPRLG